MKSLIKNFSRVLFSHRIDVAGDNAGQEHVDWSNTIIAWIVIGVIIAMMIIGFSSSRPPQIP